VSTRRFLDGCLFPLIALAACFGGGISVCWLGLARQRSEFLIAIGFLAATIVLCVLARRFYRRWDFLIGVVLCAGLGVVTVPVVQSTRWSESSGDCRINVSQLQRAVMLYTSDNDERMPLAASWRTSTKKYLETERPLRCPNAVAPYSYAMNDKVSGRYVAELPLDTVILFECEAYLENASGGKEWQANRHEGLEWLATQETTLRVRMGKEDKPYTWKPPLP
jgi:hypothetical protein